MFLGVFYLLSSYINDWIAYLKDMVTEIERVCKITMRNVWHNVDEWVKKKRNSNVNALGLRFSFTNPSMCKWRLFTDDEERCVSFWHSFSAVLESGSPHTFVLVLCVKHQLNEQSCNVNVQELFWTSNWITPGTDSERSAQNFTGVTSVFLHSHSNFTLKFGYHWKHVHWHC